jgi:hypothetical protein
MEELRLCMALWKSLKIAAGAGFSHDMPGSLCPRESSAAGYENVGDEAGRALLI